MAFTLPKLPYDYGALEPYIDAQTMNIHYNKHHQAYVDKLNAAIEKHPDLMKKTIEDIISNLSAVPEDIRTAVRNHGGGHLNHSFFWLIMKNDRQQPEGEIADVLKIRFGTLEKFKEAFSTAAATHFGSGWAWLVISGKNLEIMTTPNQGSPLTQGKTPILGLDLWEHAYYLKYQNRRPEYISAWFNVINWEKVNEHFKNAMK